MWDKVRNQTARRRRSATKATSSAKASVPSPGLEPWHIQPTCGFSSGMSWAIMPVPVSVVVSVIVPDVPVGPPVIGSTGMLLVGPVVPLGPVAGPLVPLGPLEPVGPDGPPLFAARPTPDTVTTCGVPAASSVMVTVPNAGP